MEQNENKTVNIGIDKDTREFFWSKYKWMLIPFSIVLILVVCLIFVIAWKVLTMPTFKDFLPIFNEINETRKEYQNESDKIREDIDKTRNEVEEVQKTFLTVTPSPTPTQLP